MEDTRGAGAPDPARGPDLHQRRRLRPAEHRRRPHLPRPPPHDGRPPLAGRRPAHRRSRRPAGEGAGEDPETRPDELVAPAGNRCRAASTWLPSRHLRKGRNEAYPVCRGGADPVRRRLLEGRGPAQGRRRGRGHRGSPRPKPSRSSTPTSSASRPSPRARTCPGTRSPNGCSSTRSSSPISSTWPPRSGSRAKQESYFDAAADLIQPQNYGVIGQRREDFARELRAGRLSQAMAKKLNPNVSVSDTALQAEYDRRAPLLDRAWKATAQVARFSAEEPATQVRQRVQAAEPFADAAKALGAGEVVTRGHQPGRGAAAGGAPRRRGPTPAGRRQRGHSRRPGRGSSSGSSDARPYRG